ncbi:MAG: YbhB/YbcL family Raf kinase inhibitor-like protein [Solirubrobacteraceae bacterium]
MKAISIFMCGGVLVLAGCGGGGNSAPLLPRVIVSSPAFVHGTRIPRRFTCDGADISLPVRWSGVPSHTTQLTLVMRDPDAPGGNFIHWQLNRIPASSLGLPAGHLPAGVVQGRNGFGSIGYRGPCPPRGGPPHHYAITITALRGSRAIAVGSVTGTYARR